MARLFTGAEVIDDWNPLDGVPPPDFVPIQWTGPHVGTRLADAWRTLIDLPMMWPGPRGYGSCWPPYRFEWDDLLSMIGAGEFEAMARQRNRVRVLPSALDISHMETAISWCGTYLLSSPESIRAVNFCARVQSFDGDLAEELHRFGYDQKQSDEWQRRSWDGCERIADGLIADCVSVF